MCRDSLTLGASRWIIVRAKQRSTPPFGNRNLGERSESGGDWFMEAIRSAVIGCEVRRGVCNIGTVRANKRTDIKTTDPILQTTTNTNNKQPVRLN